MFISIVLFVLVSTGCRRIDAETSLLDAARSFEPWLIEKRRELHRIPELEFDLPKTTAAVRNVLDTYGISYTLSLYLCRHRAADIGSLDIPWVSLALSRRLGQEPIASSLCEPTWMHCPLQKTQDSSSLVKWDEACDLCDHSSHLLLCSMKAECMPVDTMLTQQCFWEQHVY